MRRIALTLLVVVAGLGVEAQTFPSEFWHPGKLILLSNDTLKGELKYNMVTDMVQVNTGDRVYTFSSQKILYFEIFDVTVEYYRRFITLPYNIRPNYKVPRIFELVLEGEMSLLSREEIVEQTRSVNSYYYTPYTTFTREQLQYNFYFADKKGRIVEYSMKKRDLLEILSKRSREIKSFIKKNNLKTDRKADLVRILTYYNSII